MILSGKEIAQARLDGDIRIDPYDASRLTTNSYDFRLGGTVAVYNDGVLDSAEDNPSQLLSLPSHGMDLLPGKLYLGSTVEVMGSTKYVPIIKGKSGIARLGLFIHATADLIDIGSINQWTLQLIPTVPIRVYPNMLIGQVTFWEVLGEVELYAGKYQGSVGPMTSQSFVDNR